MVNADFLQKSLSTMTGKCSLDNISPASQTLENSASEEVVHISNLWPSVSESQQQEMESPQEMEQLHGIQPTNHRTRRTPWMYDPSKVCFTQICI